MRSAALVPDEIDVLSLRSDAEKFDGTDCSQVGKTGLQDRQLLASGLSQVRAHLRMVGLPGSDSLDGTAKRGLSAPLRRELAVVAGDGEDGVVVEYRRRWPQGRTEYGLCGALVCGDVRRCIVGIKALILIKVVVTKRDKLNGKMKMRRLKCVLVSWRWLSRSLFWDLPRRTRVAGRAITFRSSVGLIRRARGVRSIMR